MPQKGKIRGVKVEILNRGAASGINCGPMASCCPPFAWFFRSGHQTIVRDLDKSKSALLENLFTLNQVTIAIAINH
jgi:hypothetical protein